MFSNSSSTFCCVPTSITIIVSAYLLYQNAMREQFKALNPGMTFGQLAKYTSAMYSELPPAEKEAWVGKFIHVYFVSIDICIAFFDFIIILLSIIYTYFL